MSTDFITPARRRQGAARRALRGARPAAPSGARAVPRLNGRCAMAEDGVSIEHPNRAKASSKVTRLIVFALLIASAVLMAIISWGGWDTIEGAKPLQVGYILIYLLIAFLVLRWSRGV